MLINAEVLYARDHRIYKILWNLYFSEMVLMNNDTMYVMDVVRDGYIAE